MTTDFFEQQRASRYEVLQPNGDLRAAISALSATGAIDERGSQSQ